ncbi:TPR-like protein [Rickenella mellea]|uniref:TPR-like protein n=1 Tax=Rickenella mellea TaxID=50990 RepID=A0A4Y7Q285_9AGAM|nr:TPR-like protein [Rickenella mellea]
MSKCHSRLSTMTTGPRVLWAQESSETDDAKNRINITVHLPDIIESTIHCEVTNSTISFEARVGKNEDGDRHVFSCTFYADVVSEDMKTSSEPKFFFIILPKAKKGVPWPFLARQRGLSTPGKHLQDTRSIKLEVVEVEQVVANIELGILTQDIDPISCEHPHSLESRDNGPTTVPSVSRGISSLEGSRQLMPDGCDDDPCAMYNLGVGCYQSFNLRRDIGDLNLAIGYFNRAVHLTPDRHPDLSNFLTNQSISLMTRFELLGEIADIEQAILSAEHAIQITPDGHPDKPKQFFSLGNSFLTRFQRLGDKTDVEHAISIQKHALQLTPDSYPNRPMYFSNLGNSYLTRFRLLGDVADIKHAILNHERAVELTPDGHPYKPSRLCNLGTSLGIRFGRLGDMTDIEHAISNHERSVHLTPDGHPDKPVYFSNLGKSLWKRFNRLGDMSDIGRAMSSQERAVQLRSDEHPDKPTLLNNLGNSLMTRFEQTGDIADIEQAVLINEHAVQLTPDGHPGKPSRLTNLGNSFWTRFERFGEIEDIEKAILHHDQAIRLTPDGHPDKPSCFANLGNLFGTRFALLGHMTDIEHAILYHERTILLTPDGHPDKPTYFSNLGRSLWKRFDRLGDMADIDRAILNHECAIQLTPDDHSNRSNQFFNLGNSLFSRFERLGEMDNIEQAILNRERAVQLTPDGHIDKPSRLSTLADAFSARFQRFGEREDIEQAILIHKQAIRLIPDTHPDKPKHFSSLGGSFLIHFKGLGDNADIQHAISNQERAVQLTPDSYPDKPTYISNLGTSFSERFRLLGDMVDIEQAILNHRRAIQLVPDGHSDKPSHLSNHGNSLLTRFQRLGDISDIEQAILDQESAVQLTPEGHSEKPNRLNNLGNSLATRFVRTGCFEDLVKSMVAYRTSAHLLDGPPSKRLYAAKQLSWLARRHLSDQSILDAYRVAFEILPRVAWVGLSIDSRHHELLETSSLACDAAAAAMSENDPQMALSWLEQGRSIVWGQILQLRTPVDELRLAHPELAGELTQISQLLERGTSSEHFMTGQHDESREAAVQKHRQLARDWDRIVEQVRQNDGFQRFLLPKQFSELRCAAREGPVVVLNVSQYGCDALVIESLSEHPHHVRLEDFSYEKAQTLRQSLHNILSSQHLRARYDDRGARPVFAGKFRGDDGFRPILAELWKSVVKPVLEHLELLQIYSPTEDKYLRITWCPTGPLAFLPIHAAGLYNDDGTSSTSLPDIAISSYTPTLTALLRNSQRATPDRSKFKFLAVIQPNTPGVAALPSTLEELEVIRKHVPNSSVHVLEGVRATIAEVASGMDGCSWVHLACHGVQDTSHPMGSGLLLQNGRLELSKIIQKRLDHAEFAFLSACQTATGDVARPEEAIHLAAGMLLAGYRGVVATMWSIRDDDAPFVADKVYTRLLDVGQPNGANGAEALQLAIRQLREKSGGCTFSSWVPFIYMGV